MGKLIETQGLAHVGFTAAGCLDFCKTGPLMVVYPEGIWYRPTTPEDIDEIVEQHFKNGKRVDRLIMILTKSERVPFRYVRKRDRSSQLRWAGAFFYRRR
jgi:(2Fe-2S) ferredoxin